MFSGTSENARGRQIYISSLLLHGALYSWKKVVLNTDSLDGLSMLHYE